MVSLLKVTPALLLVRSQQVIVVRLGFSTNMLRMGHTTDIVISFNINVDARFLLASITLGYIDLVCSLPASNGLALRESECQEPPLFLI